MTSVIDNQNTIIDEEINPADFLATAHVVSIVKKVRNTLEELAYLLRLEDARRLIEDNRQSILKALILLMGSNTTFLRSEVIIRIAEEQDWPKIGITRLEVEEIRTSENDLALQWADQLSKGNGENAKSLFAYLKVAPDSFRDFVKKAILATGIGKTDINLIATNLENEDFLNILDLLGIRIGDELEI